MTGGFGHVEVRAVEDDPGLVVAGAGQGVEQRGAGGFVQADGLRGDLRTAREVRDRSGGDDLFDRVAADAVTQQQLVLAEHFQVEGFIGRAGLAELLQLSEGHKALGGLADLLRCFQAEGQERVEVGAGQMDPALPVAFDVDHAQDGQGAVTGDDFGEAADGRFEFGHGQFDDGSCSWDVSGWFGGVDGWKSGTAGALR